MSLPIEHNVRFVVGSRKLLAVPRRIVPVIWSLEDLLQPQGRAIGEQLPDCTDADGYLLRSVPARSLDAIFARHDGWPMGGRQDYRRHYIGMEGTFAGYFAGFSSKTRSTLRRKVRKLAAENGGMLDLRAYRTPQELAEFLRLARPLNTRTYQARLLNAGLPEGPEAEAEMHALAQTDSLRAYLLFLHGQPIAYLYLPVVGETLVYAYLGYAPEHAHLSPGTVLQLEALERLFAEERFRYFDFTEGNGAHKALFGTESVDCATLLLLKPEVSNRLLLASLSAFDSSVAVARSLAERTGALAQARRLLRG